VARIIAKRSSFDSCKITISTTDVFKIKNDVKKRFKDDPNTVKNNPTDAL